MINRITRLTLLLFLPFILVGITCCDRNSAAHEKMDLAEELMLSAPDSSLSILDSISLETLHSEKDRARYALLKSMALDKNYIDTTVFDILQPAIDYYLDNGTPDEKLRTHFYQGRIYQNQGDKGMAMQCFLRGNDLKDEMTDTLTFANLLVAQTVICLEKYEFDYFIKYHLQAADLFKKIGRFDNEIHCLLCALDGCFIKNNKHLADSVITIARERCRQYPDFGSQMEQYNLCYIANFGTKTELLEFLRHYNSFDSINETFKIDIAYAFKHFGDGYNAKRFLNMVDTTSDECDYTKYLAVKPNVLALNGNYAAAFEAYNNYSSTVDSADMDMLIRDLAFAEVQHVAEKQNLLNIHKRDRLIWISTSCALLILIIAVFIYYRYRLGKTKSLLIERDKERLQLQHDNLTKENQKLDLEKKNAILEKQSAESECNRHKLEAENLQLKIRQLEEESCALKEILQERNDISKPVADAIKTRIEMLNSLFAKQIKDNASNAMPYMEWIEKVINDKDEFMNTTRLAFTASHPKLIEYLQSHGLTESEINHCCLYAIGLRGKDIVKYTQQKRHYHMSSDIRKKLGLQEQDTNINLFIQSLMKKL